MNNFPQCYEARRSWGSEYLILIMPSRYTVKLLRVNEGYQGGLQYHHLKSECGLVLEGELLIRSTDPNQHTTEKKLFPNDFFFFPAGFIHQEHAIKETYILEISTPHFNDRVRLDHNSSPDNPLPSTDISDVLCIAQESEVDLIKNFGFELILADTLPVLNLIPL